MSGDAAEALMASLYTNHALRREFMRDPATVLGSFDLDPQERQSFLEMDRPGLVLAANSFSYKRWKANQWRHADNYPFVTYDDLFDAEQMSAARRLFSMRIAEGLCRGRPQPLTPAGLTSDLFDAMPGNQIDHEHVLLEQSRFADVAVLWKRLFDLHLRDHHLIRMFFLRLGKRSPAFALHPRAGSYMTYIMLSGDGTGASLRAEMNSGAVITSDPVLMGRVATYPGDVRQCVDFSDRPAESALEFLCIKTLSTAV